MVTTVVGPTLQSGGADKINAQRRSNPGILVLSASMHLLFMNQEAAELARVINRWKDGKEARGVLPSEVVKLFDDTRALLLRGQDVKEWEGFQLQRLSGDPTSPVLLRSYGFPDTEGALSLHVLILMEKVGYRRAATTEELSTQFQVTEREQAVLQCLVKGFTNKAVARSLGISEQTVKEHVKRLLHKTRTRTRTGMIAQVLLAAGTPAAGEEKAGSRKWPVQSVSGFTQA